MSSACWRASSAGAQRSSSAAGVEHSIAGFQLSGINAINVNCQYTSFLRCVQDMATVCWPVDVYPRLFRQLKSAIWSTPASGRTERWAPAEDATPTTEDIQKFCGRHLCCVGSRLHTAIRYNENHPLRWNRYFCVPSFPSPSSQRRKPTGKNGHGSGSLGAGRSTFKVHTILTADRPSSRHGRVAFGNHRRPHDARVQGRSERRKPQVAYRETIRRTTEASTSGRPRQRSDGHVKLRLEPQSRQGLRFVNDVIGGRFRKSSSSRSTRN